MATFADILPDETEQLSVFGQKGSGKTTLIRKLIDLLKNKELVIVIDSKPDWEDLAPMFGRNKGNKPRKLDLKYLWTLNGIGAKGVYVYQTLPDIPAYADPNVDKLIYWALRRYDRLKKKKGLTIIVDELADFSKGTFTTPGMSKLIRQGRSKHVRTILGSQRPRGVPTTAVDQAQRYAIFMLMNAKDRKRLADDIHPGLDNMAENHDFYYYEIPRDRPRKALTLMRQ